MRNKITSQIKKSQKHDEPSFFLLIGILILLLTGCSGEKILVANFEGNPLGQPPLHNQEVGFVDNISPGVTNVVEKIPNISSNWIKIHRPGNPQIISGIIGTAKATKGVGTYTFTATLYIPDTGGVATIQFEPYNQIPPGLDYLHIDFLQNNKIRVNDDDQAVFGSFPFNQPFIIQVTLNIKATGSTADILLSGANTSGEMHVPALIGPSFAPQFGKVRIWMGYPWTGSFYATNIVLRHDN